MAQGSSNQASRHITVPQRIEIKTVRDMPGFENGFTCQVQVRVIRSATDYTVRFFPYHKVVAVPLEEVHII